MRTFDDVNRLFREMDRMFEQMRTASWHDAPGLDLESGPTMALELEGDTHDESRPWLTGVGDRGFGDTTASLEEEDGSSVFVMDLPGFEKTDIDLTFDDGVLSIRAEADRESGTDTARSMRSRRVSRRVPIPTDVVTEEIAATYRNGVLEVRLPIADEERDAGHRIDIE